MIFIIKYVHQRLTKILRVKSFVMAIKNSIYIYTINKSQHTTVLFILKAQNVYSHSGIYCLSLYWTSSVLKYYGDYLRRVSLALFKYILQNTHMTHIMILKRKKLRKTTFHIIKNLFFINSIFFCKNVPTTARVIGLSDLWDIFIWVLS